MKIINRNTAMNVCIALAMINLAVWVTAFFINYWRMSSIELNSDKWFEMFDQGIKYIAFGAGSHLFLIIGSFINTSRK